MSSFIDKLSVLLNAQVNELLGRNSNSPLARIRLNANEPATNPRRSAQQLRARLEEAVGYEDKLQARIDKLMDEALDLDEQVDAALGAGDSYNSRRLQTQLNLKQQQLAIAESELREHRLVTRHLMKELVALEATLGEQEMQSARVTVEEAGRSASQSAKAIARDAADKFNETLGALGTRLPSAKSAQPRPTRYQIIEEAPDPNSPKPQGKDAKVMNKRLSRLSRPDDKEDRAD
ncbi:MAG: hypothetical protein OXG92_03125 [Chloroflexi bacterium]|nr:hypothetical protein [Chloroflexota bacterium]MCY3580993.1 hypothetical protein [Chloroflexota bacterium]MCY3715444.1 hypothetical protein [Chloroflexota bacterium]MDE2651140.1 hypothetical protein [Chloroflexota bacterium]MXV92997.1 hypothetical protein [Chloroflexota bacterium]